MDKPEIAASEVLEMMVKNDRFSRWLGLVVDEYRLGYCKLHYQVTEQMLNGFDIAHGGIIFSAADSAFAFACNSHGRIALALDASINFTRPAKLGDRLTVEAKEVHLGNKISLYEIRVSNQNSELVAVFNGTAYRTSKALIPATD